MGPSVHHCAQLEPLYYYIPTRRLIVHLLGHRSAIVASRRTAVAEVYDNSPCVEAAAQRQVGRIAEGTTRKRALRMRPFMPDCAPLTQADQTAVETAVQRPIKGPFVGPQYVANCT